MNSLILQSIDIRTLSNLVDSRLPNYDTNLIMIQWQDYTTCFGVSRIGSPNLKNVQPSYFLLVTEDVLSCIDFSMNLTTIT